MNDFLAPILGLFAVGFLSYLAIQQMTKKPKQQKRWVRPELHSESESKSQSPFLAAYWNRCLDSTVGWVNEAADLKAWDKKAKESLAIGVCNGAVYEPKLKTN